MQMVEWVLVKQLKHLKNSNESDYDRLPGLIDEYAEEDMGPEVYKRDHVDSDFQPCAPGGPIKEKRVGDSSYPYRIFLEKYRIFLQIINKTKTQNPSP